MNGDSLMPQVLKQEIEDKIVVSAKELFIAYGYDSVSMSMIARNAGIAVGNIYRYFSGKDQLFRHLARPVALKLKNLFSNPPKTYSNEEVEKKIAGFLHIYDSERDLLFFLLENSHNTEFQGLKQMIIEGFAGAALKWRDKSTENTQDRYSDVFIKAYAIAYVNGIISIFAGNMEDTERKAEFYQFASFMKNSLQRDFRKKRGIENE